MGQYIFNYRGYGVCEASMHVRWWIGWWVGERVADTETNVKIRKTALFFYDHTHCHDIGHNRLRCEVSIWHGMVDDLGDHVEQHGTCYEPRGIAQPNESLTFGSNRENVRFSRRAQHNNISDELDSADVAHLPAREPNHILSKEEDQQP